MQKYLKKRALFPRLIPSEVPKNLGLIVAIPCHNESYLCDTLASLAACGLPACSVEIIVLINDSETSATEVKTQNQASYEAAKKQAADLNKNGFSIFPLYCNDLPKKHAGVGLARKIAMDEAVRRFDAIAHPKGVIVCLDADSLVEKNYFMEIHDFFQNTPNCQAVSIHYEHPISQAEYAALPTKSSIPQGAFKAIISYELHLRYYVHALKNAGLKTATQTVGSSMAVRADAYCAQSGMNRRKAGEDFYFIHKFTGLGGYAEIKNTMVIPSPRVSDRVPFGTGKAVGDALSGISFFSYNPLIFSDLKMFLSKLAALYFLKTKSTPKELQAVLKALPKPVFDFLEKENFEEKLEEIYKNTTNESAFTKRFFQWFDAFLAMKYVHFARDAAHPSLPVETAVKYWLKKQKPMLNTAQVSEKDLLLLFRAWDRA